MMRAFGRSRRNLRIDWRACRTASPVTAQVLTMTLSLMPATVALRRITSDSAALSRQPNVMTSTLIASRRANVGEQCWIEPPLVFELYWAGHQHVIIALAPFDQKHAFRQHNRDLAVGATEPCGRDCGGTGGRAARLGQTGSALPGADCHTVTRAHVR